MTDKPRVSLCLPHRCCRNAVEVPCADCGTSVWECGHEEIPSLCVPCAARRQAPTRGAGIVVNCNPGGRAALRAYIRRNYSGRLS